MRKVYQIALAVFFCLVLLGCERVMEKPKPLIALISDFGGQDWYVSQMKGAILRIDPQARVMDLSHELQAFDIEQAAFVVARASRYFPSGTIFVVVVDPGVGTDRKGIAVKTRSGNIFVGPDNGVLSYVYEQQGIAQAHVLEEPGYFLEGQISTTFHGRDIFGPVAAHLAEGIDIAALGAEIEKVTELDLPKPTLVNKRIKGKVLYIDHYGNVITNIAREHLQNAKYDHLLKAKVGTKRLTLPYVETYGGGPKDRVFCLINSEGELEFAVKKGSAAKKLKTKVGTTVDIQL